MIQIKQDTPFITDNFLLQNKVAIELYHNYASDMPIIDYHNHLSAKKIAEKDGFSDITEAWLKEDHYKWRAMRANGIDEYFITGDATGIEKFRKWSETVPYTIRNPLFHWTHLELKHYFDIDEILQPTTSDSIYKATSEILQKTTAEQLLHSIKVEVVCTTDDPKDDLRWHKKIAKDSLAIKVLPTFRSDQVMAIDSNSFLEYLQELGNVEGIEIESLQDLLIVLEQRIDCFHEVGCRLSDYGLSGPFLFSDFTDKEVDLIIKKKIHGKELKAEDIRKYRSCIVYNLAKMYQKKNWVQQYHLGAIRNNNSRLEKKYGADAGCDSIGDYQFADDISGFLNQLDEEEKLTKTIMYNLNPSYNEMFATMTGNFNTGEMPGKMQWGAAWWFLDQKDGMEKQLNVLSNMGLLSRFIGMLTDSRSFLSFPRHDYFRRILCNMIGKDVENGELPLDIPFLGKIIKDICYYNAVNYFQFDKNKI